MKTSQLFGGTAYGLIPACDVDDLRSLGRLVRATSGPPFIVGYKVGMVLSLRYGIRRVVEVIRRFSRLPVIYDHQKLGGDIPEVSSGRALEILKDAGVNAVIVFPHGGVDTLRAVIGRCTTLGLEPIVGGEMTHKGYTVSEGGYIEDSAPSRMYLDAAATGTVGYFVVPGTKAHQIQAYVRALKEVVDRPAFLFPGIGRGQRGDIVDAFQAVRPFPGYAIVGRGIYAEHDMRAAAERLWSGVPSHLVA